MGKGAKCGKRRVTASAAMTGFPAFQHEFFTDVYQWRINEYLTSHRFAMALRKMATAEGHSNFLCAIVVPTWDVRAYAETTQAIL